jgi:hypothetical protein
MAATVTRREPMPRAVKFDRYGGIDVLRVVEVDRPVRDRNKSSSA